MIRDITLGQYYPAKSLIHQLDPRVKLVTTMIYVISLFVAKGALGYALATVFLVMVIRMSKVPFGYMTKIEGNHYAFDDHGDFQFVFNRRGHCAVALRVS